jgi:hypothetical protein
MLTDDKRSPDRTGDTWSEITIFLGDLSHFELFEVNTMVTDFRNIASPGRQPDKCIVAVIAGKLDGDPRLQPGSLHSPWELQLQRHVDT